jgi:cytochrome c oxidase assembly protein subunit 15
LWSMSRAGAPRSVLRRGEVLLVAMILQGAIGYTQYFLGVPSLLVQFHVAGAVVVVITVLRFNLGLSAHPEPVAAGEVGAAAPAATGAATVPAATLLPSPAAVPSA